MGWRRERRKEGSREIEREEGEEKGEKEEEGEEGKEGQKGEKRGRRKESKDECGPNQAPGPCLSVDPQVWPGHNSPRLSYSGPSCFGSPRPHQSPHFPTEDMGTERCNI